MKATFNASAHLHVLRPPDWDGTSEVVMEVYSYPFTVGTGVVQMFVRPRSFAVGEEWRDMTGPVSPGVATAGIDVLVKQTLTIPASYLDGGDYWHLTIQRGGPDETYAGDIYVPLVTLTYNSSY